MEPVKACLLPSSFLATEGRRMVRAAAGGAGGDKVKAQIRNAARNLGVEYQLAWRAWHGRLGGRAFPKLWGAFRKWDEDQRAMGNLEWRDLDQRIARLEQLLERGNSQTAGETSQPDPRSGLGAARLAAATG